MTGRQWILLIVALGLVAVLYSLPRSVVDNDATTEVVSANEGVDLSDHAFELPSEVSDIILSLRNALSDEDFNEKSSIFADSLIGIYMSFNYLDSAAVYVDWVLRKDSSFNNLKKTGERYFQLYGMASAEDQAAKFASKAASIYEKVLAIEDNPDIQAKLAMTKVVTSNPMSGIMMLRGILEEYPDNKIALYNMGVLSIQSGQYDKAVERFEKLMTVDSENQQAAYYLAVSYFETGQIDRSEQLFQSVKNESTDPAIINSADQYLKRLKELKN